MSRSFGTAPDVANAQRRSSSGRSPTSSCAALRLADDGDDGDDGFHPRPPLRPAARLHHADGRVNYPSYHARAVDLGAMGVPVEDGPRSTRSSSLSRSVAAGGGDLSERQPDESANEALRLPTPRELEDKRRSSRKASRTSEIAQRLSLRVKTVESQLRRLFDRYDVTSRTALARVALRQGWIDDATLNPAVPDGNAAETRVFILADRVTLHIRSACEIGRVDHPTRPSGEVCPLRISQPLATGRSRSGWRGVHLGRPEAPDRRGG